MSATQSRVSASVETMPISLWWALAIGTCATSLVALTVAAQIYLSMLHHGHSFARIALWQLCSWGVWAAATPIVLRLGARLTDRSAPMRRGVFRAIATGLLIVCAQSVCVSGNRWPSAVLPR